MMQRVWARLFPNPTYYGWVVVGTCFACSVLSSPGQSFAISLYLEHVMADLGLSRMAVSSLYGGMTLAAAAVLPVIGSWADRLGGRRYLTGVLVAMATVFGLFAWARDAVMLSAAFFGLRLLGQGAIGLGTLTVTVRWFRRYRGRALAIVALGYAAGEMIFPGVIYRLIDMLGWRESLLVFAVVYLVVFAPGIAMLLRKRRPADEPIDGKRADNPVADAAAANPGPDEQPSDRERSYTLREALAARVFWGLLVCAALPPLVMTAVIFHQVALFESNGWSAALVPAAFAAFAGAGMLSTYLTGLVLERVPSRFGLAVSLGFLVLALGSLSLGMPGLGGSLLYGGLLGLASGVSKASNSLVWPDYFGIEALGAVKGAVNATRNGATAVGPPLAAALMTDGGSFAPALLLFGALGVLGGALAVLLRPPEHSVESAGDDREMEAPDRNTSDAA